MKQNLQINKMANYSDILNYDFSNTVFNDKVVATFKVNNSITPHDFLTLFVDKKGERFAIKRPDSRETIIGIGHEYTWNLETSDFLKDYDNVSILEDFSNIVNQITTIEIDKLDYNYFGLYGGVSDGSNKLSQEWIDFSDTLFVIPKILAVFRDNEILITLFFKVRKNIDFYQQWREELAFLSKLDNGEVFNFDSPKIKVLREIYPEVWQGNVKDALEEIENETFSRVALSRKNQIVLEEDLNLPAVVKYFNSKKLSFIVFESRKSMFITSNPLLSLKKTSSIIDAYLYLQKEHLFNGSLFIDLNEDDVEEQCKNLLEEKTGYNFNILRDKTLVGHNLDIYSMFQTEGKNPLKDIKILSLLYPVKIIKGYPEIETQKFLEEKDVDSYGFWYAPVGFINSDFECCFYTCGSMVVSFGNIITLFTTILVNEKSEYEKVINESNALVEKNLKLFNSQEV